MQPKIKKENVTKMDNYSWINRFNDTSCNHFSVKNEAVI